MLCCWSLSLDGNKIEDAGCEHVGRALLTNTSLKTLKWVSVWSSITLDLNCSIPPLSISIAAMLWCIIDTYAVLRSLSLANNNISTLGWRSFIAHISFHCSLTEFTGIDLHQYSDILCLPIQLRYSNNSSVLSYLRKRDLPSLILSGSRIEVLCLYVYYISISVPLCTVVISLPHHSDWSYNVIIGQVPAPLYQSMHHW